MLKYILKRIFISLFILLGVSLIIYVLVRLMPTDYVDNKYANQLQSGSISQDDVDHFKELYGLNVPEAYLYVTLEQEGASNTYVKKIKKSLFNDIKGGEFIIDDAVKGKYSFGETFLQLTYDEKEDTRTYKIYTVVEEEKIVDIIVNGEKTGEDKVIVSKQVISELGTYSAVYEGGKLLLTLKNSSSISTTSECTAELAKFKDKAGAIIGGYFTWIGNLLKGDLGRSFKYSKPVGEVISENMWISFAIALVATILQFLIAIPLGITSATHQYSALDYAVTVFTMIGLALPTYFFAAILIKFFSADLGILPGSGLISASVDYGKDFAGRLLMFKDIALHLVLPIGCSVILSIGGLMRYTRTNTLEVLNADYIRTARAKGLSEHKVIYKHVFRNTLIPLATLLAGILPSLFGGMMITEQVFAIDGIGRLAYQALKEGDVPFVMGYNMFLAVLTVIGTLTSDIMYSIVDPRVKLTA